MSARPRAPYDPRQGDPTAANPWLRWAIVGCGAGMFAMAALAAALFLVPFALVGYASAAPEQVVHRFLEAAAAGDYPAAHGHFSAGLEEVQPLEELAELIAGNRPLFDVTDTTFHHRSVEGSRARFEGTATLAAGERVPASFTLVKEAGEWKLEAYQLGH